MAEKNRVIWCNPDLIKADRIANYNARKQQREKRAQQEEKRTAEHKPTGTRVVTRPEKTKPSTSTDKESKQHQPKQVKNKQLLETVTEECVTNPTNGPF